MAVVTIRGQLGSGAPEIGREIARRLKCDYVDREIIAGVAARLHRPEDEVTEKEMTPSSVLGAQRWVLVATAHPAKFNDIVEPVIGEPVPVPPALAALLKLPSVQTEVGPTLEALRSVLAEAA